MKSILDQTLEDILAHNAERAARPFPASHQHRADTFAEGWHMALSWACAQIADEFSIHVTNEVRQIFCWLRAAARVSPEERPGIGHRDQPSDGMAASPSSRSLQECKKRGWTAGVVERWIPGAGVRKDLLGCIDLVALDDQPGCLGIQACAHSGHAAHRSKALAEPRLREWLERGNRFVIWSWGKKGKAGKRKTYQLREEPLTLIDLEAEGDAGPG